MSLKGDENNINVSVTTNNFSRKVFNAKFTK